MIKHYTKYIETLGADKELLETYWKLRLAFQREGWSEKDLEKVTGDHTSKIDDMLKHKEAELLEV